MLFRMMNRLSAPLGSTYKLSIKYYTTIGYETLENLIGEVVADVAIDKECKSCNAHEVKNKSNFVIYKMKQQEEIHLHTRAAYFFVVVTDDASSLLITQCMSSGC